ATFTDKDGAKVEIGWNPERPTDTGELRTLGNRRTKLAADGTRTDEVKNDKDGKWNVARIETTDPRGRNLVAEFEPGKKNADRITLTDPGKNVIHLKWDGKSEYTGDKVNAKGEVIEKNVHAVANRNGLSIFWENETKDKGTT